MMEERYHATTQNWFYPDVSNVNKNITVEAKLISPPTYFCSQQVSEVGGKKESKTVMHIEHVIRKAHK